MTDVNGSEVADFRAAITRRLGLAFDDHRREFLAGVLRERAEALGAGGAGDYLRMLASPAGAGEWPVLLGLLTVTETYFFRGQEHFQALVETVLVGQGMRPGGKRRLRLLSAGCASGEEAGSLAMALKERAPWLEDARIEIVAVDGNRAMLAKARQGRYSAWSLRETPPAIREKYFRAERQEFVLDPDIRRLVDFQERNLAEPNADFWQQEPFDAVFCRNMIMYFSPEAAAELVARIAGALAPDGLLFLGHAETLRGLSQAFHLRRSHGAFYYQRRRERGAEPPVASGAAAAAGPDYAVPAGPDAAPTWFEDIGRASEKIATLAATAAQSAVAAPPRPENRIAAVLDLHRQERFADALARLRELPPDAAPDADVQVLQAVLLVNCGRMDEAETLCRPLLGRDDLNAGAHYLAALCREHADDLAAAEEHDAAAAYLDPQFAMPRFHLGLLCKRGGRAAEARRHFGEALALLSKEDPVRLVLFGGGFAREALMQACRGEIERLGGAA